MMNEIFCDVWLQSKRYILYLIVSLFTVEGQRPTIELLYAEYNLYRLNDPAEVNTFNIYIYIVFFSSTWH